MTRKQKLAGDLRRAGAGNTAKDISTSFDLEAFFAANSRPSTFEEVLVPQLIITLSPDRSGLQVELPGANGSRRVVPLAGKQFYESCLRMLQAQAERKVQIGLDGAPTQAQVKHWERHSIFPDDRCPFCLAEGRAGHARRGSWKPAREHTVGDGSIRVTRLPSAGPSAGQRSATGKRLSRKVEGKMLEELGL